MKIEPLTDVVTQEVSSLLLTVNGVTYQLFPSERGLVVSTWFPLSNELVATFTARDTITLEQRPRPSESEATDQPGEE